MAGEDKKPSGQTTPIRLISTQPHILIADDEEAINKVLQDIFLFEGFDVTTAGNGKEALEKIYAYSPDIALIDVKMPQIDGYEVCRQVKKDILFQHMPIILLTVMDDTGDKVCGLNCGADDYVTKPFAPEELLARVRMVLRRTNQTLEANPLTRLPGNTAIERRINLCIRQNMSFAMLYIDLNNFKAYNDTYGFEQGDKVIRATARILLESIKCTNGANDFTGHIGGDDFIIVTMPERMEILAKTIIKKFDQMVPEFYSPEDRQHGYITAEDRQGNKRQYPLLAIAIGITTDQNLKNRFYGEMSALGTEMKKYAKQESTSCYKIDRRYRVAR